MSLYYDLVGRGSQVTRRRTQTTEANFSRFVTLKTHHTTVHINQLSVS